MRKPNKGFIKWFHNSSTPDEEYGIAKIAWDARQPETDQLRAIIQAQDSYIETLKKVQLNSQEEILKLQTIIDNLKSGLN